MKTFTQADWAGISLFGATVVAALHFKEQALWLVAAMIAVIFLRRHFSDKTSQSGQ